jgi:hypothetical protein
MRRPRLLTGVFLLATVLVDVAELALQPGVGNFNVLSAVLWALYLSQVSMTAIWLGLGQTVSLLRTIGSLFLLTALAVLLSASMRHFDLTEAIVLTGMLAGAVAIPLLVARPLGLHIVRVDRVRGAKSVSLQPERLQFSILYLLGLMTALAVILSALKCLAAYEQASLNRVADPEGVIIIVGRGLVACAALWAAFGNRWIVVRAATFLAAILAAYGGLLATGRPYYSSDKWVMLIFALEPTLLFGSLWVFRLAGYRVVFRKARAATPEPLTHAKESG